MSDKMPAGPALEQLREVISILRQLRNAGPRDNSFKQWRQVTLTLLQRAWPGDQARAVRFRRIPFSAPSSKADARATKESFTRGVDEAMSYLEGLAQELENAGGRPARSMVRPTEAPLRAEPAPEPRREADPAPFKPPPPPQDTGPLEPSPWESTPAASDAEVDGAGAESVVPSPPPPPRAVKPAVGRSSGGSGKRLKDMLGFGDEGAAPAGEAKAVSPAPAPVAPPAAPPATPQPSFLSAPPKPAPAVPGASPPAPQASVPVQAPRAEAPAPPAPRARVTPVPAPPSPDMDLVDLESDLDSLMADEEEPDALEPPATLREMLDRDLMPSTVAAMRAARDVRSMVAMIDQLGVPPERRAIVRAALTDLGQQMDTPPLRWATIRQAFTFLMDYPQIARRIIPMLLPYLDEAA